MAGKLNARKVETLTKPGRYADGGNLYLRISPNGGKRWMFFYRFGGNAGTWGLGVPPRAGSLWPRPGRRPMLPEPFSGQGPIRWPSWARTPGRRPTGPFPPSGSSRTSTSQPTAPKFRNEKHAAQWEMTLGDAYCKAIRHLPVDAVDTEAILKVLQPIWQKVPETASRLRGRIENVLDAAKARGYRSGENPATWRGHLKTLLPARQRLTRGHHAALPYDDLPAFMAELRAKKSTAALALELCILTASRSGEVLNAKWEEFDLDKGIWTVPAIRMKAGHEHRIPLTKRAVQLLKSLPSFRTMTMCFRATARASRFPAWR